MQVLIKENSKSILADAVLYINSRRRKRDPTEFGYSNCSSSVLYHIPNVILFELLPPFQQGRFLPLRRTMIIISVMHWTYNVHAVFAKSVQVYVRAMTVRGISPTLNPTKEAPSLFVFRASIQYTQIIPKWINIIITK